jgi:4-hydroxybenzoate polyprenyltransferase
MTLPSSATTPLPDARPRNWVDRLAPASWRPYLRLARFDRPIGAWLLLFPCWWGQALAELSLGRPYPDPRYLVLFFIGAFVMRGAGCAYNDIVDRDYDASVPRTAGRPIPSGQVTVAQARMFMVALCLVGLIVLVQFNTFTILLGTASLILVAIYPFMKRLTYWPQLILGLTFKWGALVGWAAVTGSLALAAVVLYAGCVLWTIGYDTIYAHQDREGDRVIGLKSTALRFGDHTRAWIGALYAGAVALWVVAAAAAGAGLLTFAGLLVAGLHLLWQVKTLDTDSARNCLERFRSNRYVGWSFLVGLGLDMAAGSPVGD